MAGNTVDLKLMKEGLGAPADFYFSADELALLCDALGMMLEGPLHAEDENRVRGLKARVEAMRSMSTGMVDD